MRFDSGVGTGATITPHYDPMIAKVIAHAPDRLAAIRRLINALEQTVALGVRTNQAFLIDLLRHPAFQAGDLHTGFLAEHTVSRAENLPPEPVLTALALLEPLTRTLPRAADATPPNAYPPLGAAGAMAHSLMKPESHCPVHQPERQ